MSPEVDITEETVVVNETNPAVLTCVSTGIPEPNIMWFVNPSMPGGGGGNMMINSDGSKYNITSTTRVLGSQNIEVTSTLTVLETSVSDAGTYTCSATNLAGTASGTAELTVQGTCIQYSTVHMPMFAYNILYWMWCCL